MSLQAGKETIYSERFKKSLENADQPVWLKNLRQEAFDYFTEKGFPTTRDEEWKYTSVSSEQLAVSRSSEQLAVSSEQLGAILAEIESNNKVVFVDGIYNSELSSIADLPEGVIVQSFADSFESETFEANLSKFVEYDFNGFTALNTAFTEQGLFIHIPKNTKIESPVYIVFISENETANFPRSFCMSVSGAAKRNLSSIIRGQTKPSILQMRWLRLT